MVFERTPRLRRPLIHALAGRVLSLLTGCVSTQDHGPGSPYFRYPEGTRLILNQALEIQPDVRSLLCQSKQNAAGIQPNMRHLTLAESRHALGTIFTLQLPEQRTEREPVAA